MREKPESKKSGKTLNGEVRQANDTIPEAKCFFGPLT